MIAICVLTVATLGLAIGSFLNVLADRLPQNESILGRSHCDHCKRTLSARELIPIMSYMIQRGKSVCCKKQLSIQYPLVEFVTSVIFVAIFYRTYAINEDLLVMLISWAIASALVVITVADIKFHIIPDAMLAVIIVCSAPLVYFQGQIPLHAVTGLALSGLMGLIFIATRGRGLGFGDVKFAFVLGWMLGPVQGFLALYFAFLIGGLVAFVLLFAPKRFGFKKTLKSQIAFGPFMVAGAILVIVAGEPLKILITQFFSHTYGF